MIGKIYQISNFAFLKLSDQTYCPFLFIVRLIVGCITSFALTIYYFDVTKQCLTLLYQLIRLF